MIIHTVIDRTAIDGGHLRIAKVRNVTRKGESVSYQLERVQGLVYTFLESFPTLAMARESHPAFQRTTVSKVTKPKSAYPQYTGTSHK